MSPSGATPTRASATSRTFALAPWHSHTPTSRCATSPTPCATPSVAIFVYFDPPYVPMSRTATFTAYAAGGFGPEEQRRLSGVFGQLSARSVSVVLSNSSVPEVRKLYSEYSIAVVKAARAVNSKATRRGRVSEVVVSNGQKSPRAKRSAP